MEKIVSFKKDLKFNTRVSEISSISLEHNITSISDDIVSGEFLINGEYKLTEGSINKEEYKFTLPFDIALNSIYESNSVKVEIDNFDYEIIDNEFLKVSIDLLIEAKEKEVKEIVKSKETVKSERESIINKDNIINNEKLDNTNIDIDINNINNNIIDNINNIDNDINTIDKKEDNITNSNLFGNLSEETYKTYYVYIVKEDDNIDKILDKYKITKEDLELYNDITNIKPHDKIIIPQNG